MDVIQGDFYFKKMPMKRRRQREKDSYGRRGPKEGNLFTMREV